MIMRKTVLQLPHNTLYVVSTHVDAKDCRSSLRDGGRTDVVVVCASWLCTKSNWMGVRYLPKLALFPGVVISPALLTACSEYIVEQKSDAVFFDGTPEEYQVKVAETIAALRRNLR